MPSTRRRLLSGATSAIASRCVKPLGARAQERTDPSFEMLLIDPPNGLGLFGGSLNDDGLVVGTAKVGQNSSSRAFAWSPMMPLMWLAPDDVESGASDVNSARDVVGYIGPERGRGRAVVWRNVGSDEPAEELLPSEDRPTYARAISPSGEIVGFIKGEYESRVDLPVKFTADGPLMLPTQSGSASPWAVNAFGMIVGDAVKDEGYEELGVAVRWNPFDIDVLSWDFDAGGVARALNDEGLIVGESNLYAIVGNEIFTRAVVWEGDRWCELPRFEGLRHSRANGVNLKGAIVGTAFGDQSDQAIAVLWQADQLIDLNSRIPSGTGVALRSALAINGQGEILCTGWIDEERRSVGVLLKPREG